MRVLAIDPGYDRCGLAVLEYQNDHEVLLFSNCIETDRQADFNDRLHQISKIIIKAIHDYRPDTLAIETLFFNKNITTGIKVAEVRGTILYLAKESALTILEFGPQEVKVAVTGYGGSNKEAIYDMINRLLTNPPQHAKDDEYDAIAVGITALAQYGRNQ